MSSVEWAQSAGPQRSRNAKNRRFDGDSDRWFGKLPEEWEATKLKTLASLHGQKSASKSDCQDSTADVCYVTPSELGDYRPKNSTERYLPADSVDNFDVVPENSVALCTIASIGEAALINEEFVTNPQVKGLVPRDESVNPEYLFYLVEAAKQEFERLSSISVVPFINGTTLKNVAMPLPPLAVQRQIERFLDGKLDKIGKLIAKKERLLQFLDERRVALITRAVAHGLESNVPMKDSGEEWLGKIPSDWKMVQLRRVLADITNGTTATQKESSEHRAKVTRIETISTGKVNPEKVGYVDPSDNLEEYRLEAGDVLFSHINSFPMVGNVALYEGEPPELYVGMNLLRLRTNDLAKGRWVWNWFRSRAGKYEVRRRAQPAINQVSVPMSSVREIRIPLPPLREQERIGRQIEQRLKEIERLEGIVHRGIEFLEEYRSALITAAVTGEIDFHDHAA